MKKSRWNGLAVAAALSCATVAQAATYSVGKEAGDQASLDAALAAVVANPDPNGDEIVVRAGTYDAPTEYVLSGAITIRGATGKPEDVTLKATGTAHRLFTLNAPGAVVKDITLTGGSTKGYASNQDQNGGGVFIAENGGQLVHCVVNNCQATVNNKSGGGVYVKAGADAALVDRCVITNCLCHHEGSAGGCALYMAAGQVRSSLMAYTYETGIQVPANLCGAVKVVGGELVNCTIAKNSSAKCPGVVASLPGRVVNCVIAENVCLVGMDPKSITWSGDAACFTNCVSSDAINESCLVMAHPFRDSARDDFAPVLGTAAVDGGLFEDWMSGALDLKGKPRLSGTKPDIGAIEYDQEVFSANFQATPAFGRAPLEVAFTVTTAAATGAVSCDWDWDGDGTVDATTSGTTATHTFSDISFNPVRLTVTDAGGATYVVPLPVPVKAFGEKIHVVKGNVNAAPPYDTWDNAAASLETACDFAEDGCTIELSQGTHELASELKLLKAVTIQGTTGIPEDVIVKAMGSHRMLWFENADAKVNGVTICGGRTSGWNGGGIYFGHDGGMLEKCIVNDCSASGWGTAGGGIYMAAGSVGIVDGCVISNCFAHHEGTGGGMAMALYGGVARNCLCLKNKPPSATGNENSIGTVKVSGGELVNCTVADNTSQKCPGVWAESGKVVNCIIAENVNPGTTDAKTITWAGEAGCFSNCVGTCAMNDSCGEMAHPFVNLAAGDYTINLGTTPVDFGLEEEWMAEGVDFAGNQRKSGKAPDAGAFEVDQSKFSAGVVADAVSGFAPLTVNFTVTPVGATGTISCGWDWNGDGTVDETIEGVEATHVFTDPTTANVKLTVTDQGSGAVYAVPNAVMVSALPKFIYVRAESESPASPYGTWATAARTVEEAFAVAIDGNEIVISNGTHSIGAQIQVLNGVTFRGVTGDPADVTLKATSGHRMFWLDNAEAKVCDLTLTGVSGKIGGSGGAAYILDHGGTVEHCIIRDCDISGEWGSAGGGVCIKRGAVSALVDRCVFKNCRCHHEGSGDYGGGLALAVFGGVARNCLVTDCTPPGSTGNQKETGSVRVSGGDLVNCTVTRNTSNKCSGIWATEGRVVNCIVAENMNTTSADPKDVTWAGDANCFDHCVGTVAMNGSCHSVEHPFSDSAHDDFSLRLGTAAVDGGKSEDWMANAKDLLGLARVSGVAPDIGAYEYDQSRLSAGYAVVGVASGRAPLTVTFAVTAFGATGDVTCRWDLDGDGQPDAESTGPTFEHTFETPCAVAVGLTLTDAGSGRSCEASVKTTVRVFGPAILVSAKSSHPAEPYDSWENAAHDVETAVSVAYPGSEIVVSNGTYDIASEIKVFSPLTIRGLTGVAGDVTLRSKSGSGYHRLFWLDDPGARIESMTLSGASTQVDGAGVYIGVNGGTLSRCVVTNCSCLNGWGKAGGGVFVASGADAALVDSCVITGCKAHREHLAGGNAIALYGGVARNCLIVGNVDSGKNANNNNVGSVKVDGGVFVNGTVVGNGSAKCPGIWAVSGRIVNCAIGDNTTECDDGSANTSWAGDPNCFENCIGPVKINASCLAGENLFDRSKGDYRLQPKSPALDAGVKMDWMVPDGKDFFGCRRVSNLKPDLGYWELQVSGLMLIVR